MEKVTVHNICSAAALAGGSSRTWPRAPCASANMSTGPVKVVWTREEDIQHDIYRPVYRDVISATLLGRQDRRLEISHQRLFGDGALAAAGLSRTASISTPSIAPSTCPTTFPTCRLNMCASSRPRCGPASGAASGRTTMSSRSNAFIDELAHKAGKDPVAFRRSMLDGNPRLKAALDLVAEKSGWGRPLPARVGRGVSVQPSFASFIATVVEVEVDEHGEVKLRRVTSAVDTGIAVNPDTIAAQLAGRPGLRSDRGSVWRYHHRKRPRAAVELQRLPHAAHRRECRTSRCTSSRAARPGRHRRDRRHRGPAGAAQRDLRRDRRRACAACRSTARRWPSPKRHERHAQSSPCHHCAS